MTYRSKHKPSVVVEFLDEAELRIGEIRRQVVIYTRNGRNYVRPKAEFHDKFSVAQAPESK